MALRAARRRNGGLFAEEARLPRREALRVARVADDMVLEITGVDHADVAAVEAASLEENALVTSLAVAEAVDATRDDHHASADSAGLPGASSRR